MHRADYFQKSRHRHWLIKGADQMDYFRREHIFLLYWTRMDLPSRVVYINIYYSLGRDLGAMCARCKKITRGASSARSVYIESIYFSLKWTAAAFIL
jgi:hypothetical protein